MRINYVVKQKLPPLAWVALVKGSVTTVYCGKNVETKENFFVEGAWNGDFSSGNFATSDWFCGTGGKIDKNTMIFSTPSHVTSGLFVATKAGVIVSNSLHLLCAYADFHLDAQYLNYETDFNTILFGINRYKEQIHILGKNEQIMDVKVCYYRDIHVDENGNISVQKKKKTEPFCDFNDYYTRLTSAIGGMVRNSQDPSRNLKYGLVTTISKGYDAPCCAAVAHLFGCDTAVTFEPIGKYAEDSGIEIAKRLGYKNIIERDADSYKRMNMIEAEAIASGDLGTDFQFAAFDDVFAGNVVFIGERGDKIWAKSFPTCNDSFAFDDFITGTGASERKLWIGYISVPLPLYGASAWPSIQQIAQSNEMDDWSLGNNYDRPIPRRICEDAGVAREMFGMNKHGAGIILRYDWGSRAKSRMSAIAAASFGEYVKKNRRLHFRETVRYFWRAKNIYLNRLGLKIHDDESYTCKSQIANATIIRYLIPWAGEIVQNKYRKALQER